MAVAAIADLIAPFMPQSAVGEDWGKRVLRAVAERGQFGATDDELEKILRPPGGLNNIRARRNGLINAGLLVTTVQKRKTSAGSTAFVHILAPSLQAALWPSIDQSDCHLAQAAIDEPTSPPAEIDKVLGKLALLAQQVLRAANDEDISAHGDISEEVVAARFFPVATGPGLIEMTASLAGSGLNLALSVPVTPVSAEADATDLAKRLREALVVFPSDSRAQLEALMAQGATLALTDVAGLELQQDGLDDWVSALADDDTLSGSLQVALDPAALTALGQDLGRRVKEFAVPAIHAVDALAEKAVDPAKKLAAEMNWGDTESRGLWDLAQRHRQLLLAGPPGTGKTKAARVLADLLAPKENVRLVQFHPGYGYEDFVEGIRPELIHAGSDQVPGEQGGSSLNFALRRGILRQIVDDAEAASTENFVLIIDEINRANLPRVLGELLFALEYRGTTVELPYSGDLFSVPPNIWLVGTMNTADRSVAFMDAAMRRRFKEFRISPDPGVLLRWHAKHTSVSTAEDAVKRLLALNDEVRALLDDDRAIGHSYFVGGSSHG